MNKKTNIIFVVCIAIFLSSCVAWHSGVTPVYPPGKKTIPAPKVNSLTPTLKWESLNIKDSTGKVTGIRYEIIIYTISGFHAEHKIAYQKDDIAETSHTVSTPLQPSTRYFWRIRAKYKQNGDKATGEWNGFSYVAPTQYEGGKPYFFDTP